MRRKPKPAPPSPEISTAIAAAMPGLGAVLDAERLGLLPPHQILTLALVESQLADTLPGVVERVA